MIQLTLFAASNTHNLTLAQNIEKEAQRLGCDTTLINIIDLNLPLYTPPAHKNGIPEVISTLIHALKPVTHFAFITPEYNGGIAPTLTNLIAWISVCSDDWRECFNGKTAIIGTHSGGGGLHALMQLRTQLAYIGLTVIGRQLHTNYQKALNPQSLTDVVQELIK